MPGSFHRPSSSLAVDDNRASKCLPHTLLHSCNPFLETIAYPVCVPEWTFLTNHARALLWIAHDPGARLRDIAATLEITERRAFGIVTDLTNAGYVLKEKDGRRNRYRIQNDLPIPETIGRQRTIGEILELLTDTATTEAG